MIEAQLTAGLMMLFLKVLEKGVDNVIDAGFSDATKRISLLLKGSEAQQEFKRLQKIIEEIAKKEFSSGDDANSKLFTHEPFLKEIVAAVLDSDYDYDFKKISVDFQNKFSDFEGLPEKIEQFFNALYQKLRRDKYFRDILDQVGSIYQNEEILKTLREMNLPTRECEIVSQQINNIDTNIENIETFIDTYFHVEKYVGQEIHNHFTPDYEGQRLKENEQKVLNRYLNQLKTYCYNLPLSALGDEDNRLMDVQLKEVYINLNVIVKTYLDFIREIQSEEFALWGESYKIRLIDPKKNSEEDYWGAVPSIPAFDAFRISKRMILLGGPGSGKSTFVKYLLGQYIEGQLSPDDIEPGLLPVLLNFREISSDLAKLELAGKPAVDQEKLVTDALKEKIRIKVCGDGCQDLTQYFEEHWHTGALFLVLDGLDEVPEDQRARIRQTVLAVENTIHPQRLLVTCRLRSYLGDAVLSNWYAFTLAPLDEEQINGFIKIWYNTTAPKLGLPENQKEKRIKDLLIAAQRPSLAELSENPMLLTTMTLIHQREAVLPDQRVKVYKQAVELLVRRWQRYQGGDFKVSKDLDDFLNKEEKLYPLLELIAYRMHQSIKGDLNKPELLELVQKEAFPGNYNLANEFLEYIDHRSGLLVGAGSEPGKPNLFSFPHRTFEEYLAGCYLANQDDMAELLHNLAQEKNRWYLPVQYAVEYLYYYGTRGKSILRLLAFILNQPFKRADERCQRKILWAGYITRVLGKTHFNNNEKLTYDGQGFLKLLREGLIDCFGGALTPQEWVEAGEILAEIDDPRFYGTELFYVPKDENLNFIEVPAGKFWMGEGKEMHQVELPTFYLNQFMVTVDQFRNFSEAAAYMDFYPDALRDKSNQPVRWVTWYDAIKYCEWMQEKLEESVDTPGWMREKLTRGWRITLPSEAEWEKAARGNTQNQYPWGNEVNPEDANYLDTQIGRPSAVGCFPGHGLFEQFYDLSGNLWEWTRSLWGKEWNKPDFDYPYVNIPKRENLDAPSDIRRVLRGGSYDDIKDGLCCAFRGRSTPYEGSYYYGFRIVLSPPPLGSGPSGR